MEVDKSKCLNTYAWYFKRKNQDSVWINMCCLGVVQSHSGFYGSKLYMILFLGGVCEPKKANTDQGDCTYLVKSTVSCAVLFEIAVFCTHRQHFTQLKCFQLIGCVYETDD